MSEQPLINSYVQADRDRIRKWILDAEDETEQKPVAAAEPQKAPEPVQPGGFFNDLGSKIRKLTGAEERAPEGKTPVKDRKEGVMPALGRAAATVPETVSAGLSAIQEAGKPVSETKQQLPEGGTMTTRTERGPLQAAGEGALGGLQAMFPFAAAAGSAYGDFITFLNKHSGELQDEALQKRIEFAQQAGVQSDVEFYSRLLAMKPEERLQLSNEAASSAGEMVAGAASGYTGLAGTAGKLLGKAGAASKVAQEAAHAGRIEVMRAAGERLAQERAAQQTAQQAAEAAKPAQQAQAGPPSPPKTLADIRQGMAREVTPGVKAGAGASGQSIPENMMTLDKLQAQQKLRLLLSDPDAKQALQETLDEAELIREPGAARIEGRTTREQARQDYRTPLEAEPRPQEIPDQALDEIVRSTEQGGASFSVEEGRLRRLPEEGGFYVGIAPDRTVTIKGRPVTAADIADFRRDNADLLSEPGAHIGTEKLDDGTVNIDVSVRLDTKDEAFALARQAEQERIFDGSAFQSLDVPKMLELEHYSTAQGLSRTDPEKFGTGQAGREAARAGEPGFQKRSYFYTAGTTPEARFAKMPKYTAQIPEDKILDLASDAGKALVAESAGDATRLEALVRDRGFQGYRNSALNTADSSAKYAQTPGNVVSVFESLDVKPAVEAAQEGPKTVKAFHGTSHTFDEFKPSEEYGGTWFAARTETASYYAMAGERPDLNMVRTVGDAPQVRPVALTLKKSASEDLFHKVVEMMQNDVPLAVEALKKGGYDSVAFSGELNGKGPNWLVFDPNTAAKSLYGEVARELPDKVEAAKQRIAQAFQEFKQNLTGEAGSIKPRGEFTEGWEKNRQLMNDLYTVGSAYLWEGTRSFKEFSARMIAEFGEHLGPQLKTIYEAAQKQIKAMVNQAKAQIPTAKEALKLFHEGSFAGNWYDSAAEEFKTIFGSSSDLFADVLAATSPNTAVTSNITLAFKAMEQIMSGEKHAGKLFNGADGFIGAHVGNLNRVLRGEQLSGPKVGAFARALKGDKSAVVVDTWMLRAFGFPEDVAVSGVAKIDPSEKRVLFIQTAITDMARSLGIDERQVQAAIWSATKIRAEGDQVIKPIADMVYDHIKANKLDNDWLFPKEFVEAVPDWVNETGKIHMGTMFVLGRAAVAGVIGAMTGDDPETATRNALLAAGLGSVASPKLAKAVAKHLLDPEVRQAMKDAFTGEDGAIRFPARGVGDNPSPNTDRMGASVGAKRLVRGINEKLEAHGLLERSRTQTHAETIEAALRSPYRTVDSVLALDAATIVPDQLAAARTAARGVRDFMLEDVLATTAKAKISGDVALAEESMQKGLLAGRVSQQVTNLETAIARGQEAGKIQSAAAIAQKYDMNLLDTEMQDMTRAMLENGKVTPQQWVEMVSSMADRVAAQKLATAASAYPQALWNIYYGLNLLSSPLTQLRNVIGNGTALGLAIADRAAGELIALPFHAVGSRWASKMVQPGESYELVRGIYEVVADSFRGGKDVKGAFGYARDAYKSGDSLFGVGKESEALRTLQTAYEKEMGGGPIGTVVQAMSTLASKNLRFMGGTDEFFKVLSFHGELRALARRSASAEGLTGKKFAEEVERLIAEPTQEMATMATAFAKENTFTKEFTNADGWRNLGGLGKQAETVARNPFMRVLATPFFRTPMRIAEFSMVHTPILNALAVQTASDIAAGGVKANLAVAKTAVGGGIALMAGYWAAHGYITGNWPSDPQLRAAYERAGWAPKSIYNPWTGKYHSYDNLEPISSVLGTVADFMQVAPDLQPWDVQEYMTAATIAFGKNAVAKQWFSAISDIGDVIEGASRGDSIDKLLEYVHRRMASLIPGASLSRAINKATDDVKRDRKTVTDNENPELRELDRLTAIYKQNIPGWGHGQPALVNLITGEPVANENTWLGMVNPFQVTTAKTDPVLVEVASLDGAGLPRELPRVVGGPQPASPFKLPGEEEKSIREGVLLSNEERARLGVLLTKEIKDADGQNLHEGLTALIASDEYKEQKDGRYGGKANRIANLFNAYLEQAERALFDEYPRLDQIVQRRQLERGIQRFPTGMEDQENDLRSQIQERFQGAGR